MGTERAHVARPVAQRQLAGRAQPGECVQQLVFVLGHRPTQVAALADAAPVGSLYGPQARGRHDVLVGLVHLLLRLVVELRRAHPPVEALVDGDRQRRACQQVLQPGAVLRLGKPGDALPRLGVEGGQQRLGEVPRHVVAPAGRLQRHNDLPFPPDQGGPGHRQQGGQGDCPLGQLGPVGEHLVGERQRRRRGGDDLTQGHPVALARQPGERPRHGRGAPGRPVAGLVPAAGPARARFPGTDQCDVPGDRGADSPLGGLCHDENSPAMTWLWRPA